MMVNPQALTHPRDRGNLTQRRPAPRSARGFVNNKSLRHVAWPEVHVRARARRAAFQSLHARAAEFCRRTLRAPQGLSVSTGNATGAITYATAPRCKYTDPE